MARTLRMLIGVVAAFAGLSGGAPAIGATLRADPSRNRASDEHPLHCKCATRCRGASCCCGPRDATPPREPAANPLAAVTTPDASGNDVGPCLAAAPCDGAIPSAPAPAPGFRCADPAALPAHFSRRPSSGGPRGAPAPSDRPPDVTTTPPEEPPEPYRAS